MTVLDSGHREEFPTGSRRDTRDGKGRFDLLPPRGVTRLAQHFEAGAKKYGDGNWTLGQPHARFLDSALRHLFKHLSGKTDEDHLIAAAWNLICAADQEERISEGLLPKELLGHFPGAPGKRAAAPESNTTTAPSERPIRYGC